MVSKVSSISQLSYFNLKRNSHSMLQRNPMVSDNLTVKALHDFLDTSPDARASVPSLQNPTTQRPAGRLPQGLRVHCNPITGGTRAYRSSQGSAVRQTTDS